jgi:predicted neuraminidase
MAASVESANSQQMPSTSSETSQNTVLTTIANQYNTNSILPLRLIDQQNGDGTSPLRSQNLQG